jgi:hypothetical protein
MPMAMNPEVGLVNLQKVVKTPPCYRGNVVLEHSLLVTDPCNDRVWAFVAHNDARLNKLVGIHQIAKLSVAQLFVMPPIVPFSPSILVDRQGTPNTKDIISAKCRSPILNPEGVARTSGRIVVITSDEVMLSLGHCVIGWVAILFLCYRVAKPDSKVSHLKRTLTTFQELLVGRPLCVNISNKPNKHISSAISAIYTRIVPEA